MIVHLLQDNTIVRNGYVMNNNKIVEFNKYVKKYEKISRSFEEQVEAEILTIDEVREKRKEMTKKLEKLVLDIHPYAINQLKGKDSRYFTSVKEEGKERKIIKKNTYEELIDYLIDYYKIKEVKQLITLRTMYPIWIEYKNSCTKKTSTIRRIEADWKKYYKNDPIVDVPLENMSKNQITEWLNKRIIKDGLTNKKNFYNMITIFKNIFEYCYDEELVKENTFLKAKYRKELLKDYVKPEDETQVFTKDEQEKIISLAYSRFKEDIKHTAYLGVALMFQTGLRVGELVVLKSSDYDKAKKTLHISKGETRTYARDGQGELQYVGALVGDPKKQASVRDIPLTDEACGIIELLIRVNDKNGQSDEDYLFVFNNRRIKGNCILKRLYALCDELEIDRRSTHKIRKTTLSKMLDVCIKQDIADISAIRAVAGHVDETTLLKNYLFSTRKDEMPLLITTALSSNAWKHLETFS